MKERVGVVGRVVAILVALSLPVIVIGYQFTEAAHQRNTVRKEAVQRSEAIAKAACESLNQYRHEDKAKWEFILVTVFPPAPPETPLRKQVDALRGFLNVSDAPKDC